MYQLSFAWTELSSLHAEVAGACIVRVAKRKSIAEPPPCSSSANAVSREIPILFSNTGTVLYRKGEVRSLWIMTGRLLLSHAGKAGSSPALLVSRSPAQQSTAERNPGGETLHNHDRQALFSRLSGCTEESVSRTPEHGMNLWDLLLRVLESMMLEPCGSSTCCSILSFYVFSRDSTLRYNGIATEIFLRVCAWWCAQD